MPSVYLLVHTLHLITPWFSLVQSSAKRNKTNEVDPGFAPTRPPPSSAPGADKFRLAGEIPAGPGRCRARWAEVTALHGPLRPYQTWKRTFHSCRGHSLKAGRFRPGRPTSCWKGPTSLGSLHHLAAERLKSCWPVSSAPRVEVEVLHFHVLLIQPLLDLNPAGCCFLQDHVQLMQHFYLPNNRLSPLFEIYHAKIHRGGLGGGVVRSAVSRFDFGFEASAAEGKRLQTEPVWNPKVSKLASNQIHLNGP